MGAGRHGGDPRAGVSNCRSVGAVVASRDGHKHTCVRSKEEGYFHRVHEDGAGAADRVVNHVYTIGHSLIDCRHKVTSEAAGLGAIFC